MAETIPGGAFLLADKKTWVNANGTKIAAPRADSVYVRPEEPAVLTESQVTPGSELVDEFGKPTKPLTAKERKALEKAQAKAESGES